MSFETRLERLRIALGAARRQMAELPAGKITMNGDTCEVLQDFTGGDSTAQLEFELMRLIQEIGAFPDHLRRRLKDIGCKHRLTEVEPFFMSSRACRIVHDLNNVDKHANHDRQGGWSNESPEIRKYDRLAQCKVGGGKSRAGIMFDMTGKPRSFGDGDTAAVTTGEVHDKAGKLIGMAHDLIEEALVVCERAVDHFAVR
jgi:hypothetical protein